MVATRLFHAARQVNSAVETATRRRFNIAHVLVGIAMLLLGAVYGSALSDGFSPLYLMVIPIGVIGLWMIFSIPEYAALLLCGLRWGFIFDAFDRTLRIQSPAIPLAVLLLIVVLARCFGPRRQKLTVDSITWLLLLYFGWVCLGLWYAQFQPPVETRIIDFAKDVLISLVIMSLISTPVIFERTVYFLIGIGAMFATLTLYQEFTQTYNNDYWGLARVKVAIIVEGLADRPRASGPLGDPNFYGQILLMTLPLAMWLVFNGRHVMGRLAGAYTVLVVLAAIAFTYSRGTLIALLLVAALYFYFFSLDLRYLLFLIPVAIASVILAPPELKARFGTLTALTDDNRAEMADFSFQRRSVEVTMAWYMFLDHPIIGIGADNYRPYYPLYIREFGAPVEDVERNAHSYYLEVAAEHGLIGLGLVGAMIVLGVKRIRQAARDFRAAGHLRWAEMAQAYLIGFYGYLATAVILHGDFPRLLWIHLALAVGLGEAGRQAVAAAQAEAGAVPEPAPAPSSPTSAAASA